MARNKPTFGDALRGTLKGAIRRESHGEMMARIKQETAERVAREEDAKRRLQEEQWERKFRDGRSPDLKIRWQREIGFTDVYFGGQGKPDGEGHGHIRIWPDGREQVVREPYSPGVPGARKDATLLDDVTPDKRF